MKDGVVQESGDAPVPGRELVEVKGVAQAEHGPGMLHFVEGRRRVPANALSRRVGGQKLGMFRLNGPEFAKENVISSIADDRIVQGVIPVVVRIQFPPQFRGALFRVDLSHTVSLLRQVFIQL